MSATVLVVEDESAIQELIAYNLRNAGYTAVCTNSAEQAAAMVNEVLPDLVLLDWMLPGKSGIELARSLRRDPRTKPIPVIMLTARVDERDKVIGLETGADDYVTKPFRIRELIARIKAVMRRISAGKESRVVRIGRLNVDFAARSATDGCLSVNLTATEWQMLEYLYRNRNQVLSREQIIDCIWGINDLEDSRAVDVHIGRLRRKIEPGNDPETLVTIRGFGYSLKC
ncbi:MAG TPA: response regulator [Nitrosomonas europaea]|nr:response regulator [Nitrosomonas europaea]